MLSPSTGNTISAGQLRQLFFTLIRMKLKSIYNSERFLKILFGSGLFIVLWMGGLAYKYIRELSKSLEMVQHTYDVHDDLKDVIAILKDAESGKRGFIISGDTTYLNPLLNNREQLGKILQSLKILTSDNNHQQENLKDITARIDRSFLIFDKTLNLAKQGKTDTNEFKTVFDEGRRNMDSIRSKMDEITDHENDLLKLRRNQSSQSLSIAPLYVYYVLILSLAVLLLTYVQISSNLKDLRVKNEQLETFKESATQSALVSKHGNWIWHVNENRYEFSDNLYRLIGEEPGSFDATIDSYMTFVHPDDREKLTGQINQMYVQKNLPNVNYRIIQRNGTRKCLKANAKLFIDHKGQGRLLGTTADVTDETEGYRLLEEKNAELKRNNEELASFNYVASHDLQEPLRKIQTFISRLEDKELESLSNNGKMYIERIKTSSDHMRSLIEDLLQYSRTNKSDKAMEPCDINELLESAKQDQAEVIKEKKATIISDTFPVMKVIPFQIQQLFQNLISNSLKYSKDNEPPVLKITYSKRKASSIDAVKSIKYKNYHTITFEDNGIGFEPQYAEKIFLLFNRLHNKSEYSGTGIGLTICKKIVDNHGGHISAIGQLDKGAVFTIYLPVKIQS